VRSYAPSPRTTSRLSRAAKAAGSSGTAPSRICACSNSVSGYNPNGEVSAMTGPEAVGIGLGFLAIVAPDFWPKMPRALSYVLAGVGLSWLTYSAILAIQEMTHMKLHYGPLGLIILGAVCIAGGIFWHISRLERRPEVEKSPVAKEQPQETVHPETGRLVSQAQFTKVTELEKFFGGKEEYDLRVLFDLPFILDKNIQTQLIRMSLIKAGREKEFFYNNYSDNGSFIFWAKEGYFKTDASGVQVFSGPKDVHYLVTTTKFQTAQRKLVEFMNSALIPESIKHEVSKFNATIHKNTELMTSILDARLNQDDRYFTHYNDMSGPFYAVISNDFADKIIHLKPQADRILAAIAASWKISK
jgi:hypothetical protein